VNFPTHGSGPDVVVDALPAGCSYKSAAALSMHGAGCSASSSSPSSLLLDQQRPHVCATPSATSGSMLPSFGFTQEQVRARQPITHSYHNDKQTVRQFGRKITAVYPRAACLGPAFYNNQAF